MILVEFLYEKNLDDYVDYCDNAYGLRIFKDEAELESYLQTYAMLSRRKFERENEFTDEDEAKVYYYSPYQDKDYIAFNSFADFREHFTILTSDENIIHMMLNGNSYFSYMKGEFPRIELSGR